MTHPVPSAAEALLAEDGVMAHLATCVDDRPHVAPVWYHYDDGVLEVLTTGRKLANVRQNPKVAVSVQCDVDGRAAWMVALLGRATVIESEEARRAAAGRIYPRYPEGADQTDYPDNVLVRIEVGSARYQQY